MKWGPGTCGSARPRLLQQPVSGSEGDRRLETCHRSVDPEWVCHPYQVPDGDRGVGLQVGQEGRRDTLRQPQRHLFSDPHLSEFSAIYPVCCEGSSISVLSSLFQPGISSSGLHQSLFTGIGVDSSMGDSPAPASGRLVGCGGVSSPSSPSL